MLVDHGGVDVGYLRAFGEAVDDEGVQRVGVRDAHVQEEVARRRRRRTTLMTSGRSAAQLRKPFDVLAGRRTDRYGDQRLDVAAERVHRDRRVIARDHARGVQRAWVLSELVDVETCTRDARSRFVTRASSCRIRMMAQSIASMTINYGRWPGQCPEARSINRTVC